MNSFLDDAEHQTSTWSPGYQGSPGLYYQYNMYLLNTLEFMNMLISVVIMIVNIIIIQIKNFFDDAEHLTSTWSPGYQGSPGSSVLRYQYIHSIWIYLD